ncbi:hypothetical protein BJF96_g615 [Verticillium dahliae]|uniref:Uncharacterized protein n=1 Tax=Verticillium dahliae TaxID=27337 RepID=A0AA45ARN2_VERDA|nr:hypothetical protein BJF96_g615 [Verticillium dahliae]PNH50274.1 hypothetical protein VD0003_g6894 [Verticillium dahliae]
MNQILAALHSRQRKPGGKGKVIGVLAFDTLQTTILPVDIDVRVDLDELWRECLVGPEILGFLLDCNTADNPVSGDQKNGLQDVAMAALDEVSQRGFSMPTGRDCLVEVLYVMLQRKSDVESYRQLILQGLEVADGSGPESARGDLESDDKAHWWSYDSDEDRYDYDGSEHDSVKDFTACDKECGYCGHCDYKLVQLGFL